jgi:hypothetical protein
MEINHRQGRKERKVARKKKEKNRGRERERNQNQENK